MPRLLVMTGGVVNNFILAIIIYAGIAWYWGEKTIPYQSAYEGMDFTPAAQALGFRNGDILLTADGRLIDSKERASLYKMLDSERVEVLRNHRDTVTLIMPDNAVTMLPQDDPFMAYRIPVFVKQVMPGEPADKAGLAVGDRIIAVGDSLTPAYTELAPALSAYSGKEVGLTLLRGTDTVHTTATPTAGGKLGFGLMAPLEIFRCDTTRYGLLQSIPIGVGNGTEMLTTYVG
ncbi:MAG: PDZ domain-containing protein, partial [Muribaculaceae bacterium]|nr:PDZ domain-containing protein [Muribaculaceae bacterium]